MNKPFILGLTGGIGTGKTTVALMLKELGAYIIDADEISRHALDKQTDCYLKTVETFGREILQDDGTVDRKKLAATIFSDPTAREKLNGIIHPHVKKTIFSESEKAAEAGERLVIWDIPLLFETGYELYTDAVLVVTCPLPLRLERLKRRSGLSESEALDRICAQMSDDERCAKADFVIDNAGTLDELKSKVRSVYDKISTH